MNLNSYIGLMGGRFRELDTPMGVMLAHADQDEASFVVPDSDYVLTLDADSVLVPEYALRLVYLLEQREHAKDAVAQTPYSAFPGAATRIERIAGATTDLQHIIHQGMTFYGASFWVGANAVLRKAALDQIVETEYIGGWPIHRYIRDRTLIEDTESTIDLAAHGWGTYNYPERLAYSATPADFGSLCIQRHRWANGGLLIVPRLLQCIQLRRKRGERTTIGELLLRLNYMASTFWCSVSVLFLLLFPFNGHLLSPLTFAIPVPYFAAMATDLRYCGYKPLDILRVYGFNLLLLPVNLAGSLSSIAQGLTGAKGRFRRTPKVRNRTVPAFTYVVLPYVVVAVAVLTLARAYDRHLWWNAIFAVINTVLGTYAIVAFIGIRNSIVDVWLNVVSWLYKPASAKRPAARKAMPTPIAHGTHLSDWESVLYIGSTDDGESRPARAARALPAATVAAAPADAGAPAEPHGILDRDSYLEDPELVVKETGLQPR
jgi:cellulose synthase/poly-beta-1,6-N-acetylglucosamine synthase-like glycosyltransferase